MKLMKRLSMFTLVGVLGLSTFSCLNNDDSDFTNYGFLATTAINVHEDSIQPVGEATNIHVTYQKTNSCQKFVQFSILKGNRNDSVQYIGLLGSQRNGADCEPITSMESKKLLFKPEKAGRYKLKFWTGKDTNNNDIFNDSIILDIKEK